MMRVLFCLLAFFPLVFAAWAQEVGAGDPSSDEQYRETQALIERMRVKVEGIDSAFSNLAPILDLIGASQVGQPSRHIGDGAQARVDAAQERRTDGAQECANSAGTARGAGDSASTAPGAGGAASTARGAGNTASTASGAGDRAQQEKRTATFQQQIESEFVLIGT